VIADNDEGKLEAAVSYYIYDEEADPPAWVEAEVAAFTNSYLAEGVEVELGGTKTLENRNKALGDDEFEFALYKSDVDGIEGAHVETVSNVGGIFKFSKLDFDAEGTYYYLIKEVDGGLGWFTYDTKEYLVKVVITDNDEGKLEAVVTYWRLVDDVWVAKLTAAFTNSYLAEGVEVELGGTKTLENRNKALGDDEFEFALYKSDVDGIEGAHVETVSNVGGIFKFSKLSYADGAEGTYYYLIKEVDGGLGWFTYDTKEYLVKVVITDNDEGKLEAAVSYYIYDGEADPPAWVEAEVAAFTNSYLAEGVEVELGGTKTLENRNKALGDDEFEFALYKSDVDGIEGAHVETVSNVGGIFKFSKLDFDAEGTYYYLIKEVDGGLGWFTYDTKEYLVKVVITDNDEGKLEAAVSYYIYDEEADPPAWVEAEVAAFTNSYLAEGVEVELGGTKTLENRNKALGDDEFEFALYKSDVDGIEGAHVETVSNVGGIFKFSKLDFDAEGTYYYLIKEVDGGLGWFTYDTKEYLVKVVITDNDEGKLEAVVTYWRLVDDVWVAKLTAAFTNSYLAEGVEVELGGTKTLENRNKALGDDEFEFALYKSDVDGIEGAHVETVSNVGGIFKFSKLDFDAEGTYYYLIKEVDGGLGWFTYDTKEYLVKVVITDNDEGKLEAAVSYYIYDEEADPPAWVEAEVAAFTNSYLAEGVEVELGGTKTLENRNKALGDDEFEFALYKSDVDGIEGAHVETVSNVGGIFKFSKLDFDAEGTYYYLIKEVDGGLGWFTYDTKEYLVKVVITDNDEGKLEAAVSYYIYDEEADPPAWVEAEVAAFTNSYLAEGVEVELGGTKTLENRNKALGDDEFEFALYKSDVDGIEGAHVETVSNVGGIFKFSKLDFDAEGTYYYLIKEVDGGLGWFTYDTKEYLVKVVITDNDEGKLEAVVTYWRLVDDVWVAKLTAAFTNSYLAEGVEVELGGTKTLENRNKALGDDEFEFALYKSDVDGIEGAHVETVSNVGGIFKFSKLDFDAEGTYYYLIKEVDGGLGWFTYDTKEYLVKVVIADNDEGKLEAAVSYYIYDEEADPPAWVEAEVAAFTNSYLAEGVEVELGGTKTLENRNKALGDDEFEFALYKSDVDGIEGAHVETVSNVGGIFKFSKLSYADGAEGTYYYLIKEVDGGLGWFTYDTKEYLVKVVITDNDEGKLEAAVSYYIYDGEADPPAWVEAEVAAFTNSYLAEGVEVELGGTKTLLGRDKALGDDEFEFALYKSDVDGIEGAHVETVSNVGGIFKFSKLSYADGAEGTYYYLIKEVDGGLGWFTYDTKEYLVKVVITDNDEGKLEAAVSYYIYDGEADPPAWVEAEVAAFTNSYLADGEWMPEVRKELTGRSLKPGEFSFELNGDGLNHALAATNDGAGRVVFKPIKYTEQDVGKTYYYTVEEIQGNLGGVTYDKHVLKIKVEVKDFENGELDLRVTYDGSTTFTNRYNASGAYAPVATKVAVDFTLEAGQFEFELVDPLGNVLRTAKNTALGGVQFAPLEFGLDDIGKTFVYTIREVEGTLEKIIYDDTEYTLTLTVSDQGDGTLLVQRKAGEAPAIFTNLLEIVGGEEDEIPDDGEKTPATGQQISVYTYLAAAMLVLAVVSAILALKPRKKDTTA
jgi:pilin isopeptide linkage protein